MKVTHNMIHMDIPELIRLVANNEFLTNKTKDIVIHEFENISEQISLLSDDGILDIEGKHKGILEKVDDSDIQMLENLLFTTIPKISDIKVETISIEESATIPEEKKVNDKLPIFFLFNGGDNALSKAIMLFTRSDFSHVSISLNGISEIVSFGTTRQNHGLVVENWFDFCHIRNPKNIAVHFIDVPLKEYEKIKHTIEYHKANTKDYYYSFKKLFTAPFRRILKPEEESNGFICSEFVYYLLNGTSVIDDLTDKDKNDWFITPKDFRNSILKNSTVLFSGLFTDFNPKLVSHVFSLYTDEVLKKKVHIDKKIESKFKQDQTDDIKQQLRKYKMTLNK